MKLKIRKAYDRDRLQKEFHDIDGKLLEPCIVEQHHTEDANIQNIISKYDKTGILANVNKAQANYQDNTSINEYADMFNKIKEADENFLQLPSLVRERFKNNTGEFLEFVNNDENIEEMYDLGLANRPIEIQEPAIIETQPESPE